MDYKRGTNYEARDIVDLVVDATITGREVDNADREGHQSTVTMYKLAMVEQAQASKDKSTSFPPGSFALVADKLVVVSGAHRLHAYRLAAASVPGLSWQMKYLGQITLADALATSATDNRQSKPLTSAERQAMVKRMLEAGLTDGRIAVAMGLHLTTIGKARAALQLLRDYPAASALTNTARVEIASQPAEVRANLVVAALDSRKSTTKRPATNKAIHDTSALGYILEGYKLAAKDGKPEQVSITLKAQMETIPGSANTLALLNLALRSILPSRLNPA